MKLLRIKEKNVADIVEEFLIQKKKKKMDVNPKISQKKPCGSDEFGCEKCGKSFVKKFNLTRHMGAYPQIMVYNNKF